MKKQREEEKAFIGRAIIKNVAFFGDADLSPKNSDYQDAYEVAKILARHGFAIVNGGGPGIMDASTKGAQSVKGETLSVTFYPHSATGFEGRYVGNVTDVEVKTSNYIERMFKLMEHADIFIIFRGGTGTISEFGTAWVLAKLYFGHHKPFILFGKFWVEIIDVLKKNLNLSKDELAVFDIVTRREDVLPTIDRLERKLRGIDHKKECKVCNKALWTKKQ